MTSKVPAPSSFKEINDSQLGKIDFDFVRTLAVLTYISFSKWFEGTVQILSKMLPVWGQLGGDETRKLEQEQEQEQEQESIIAFSY